MSGEERKPRISFSTIERAAPITQSIDPIPEHIVPHKRLALMLADRPEIHSRDALQIDNLAGVALVEELLGKIEGEVVVAVPNYAMDARAMLDFYDHAGDNLPIAKASGRLKLLPYVSGKPTRLFIRDSLIQAGKDEITFVVPEEGALSRADALSFVARIAREYGVACQTLPLFAETGNFLIDDKHVFTLPD